jgi:hypothetical protein
MAFLGVELISVGIALAKGFCDLRGESLRLKASVIGGCVPCPFWIIPWHLPYNWGKARKTSVRVSPEGCSDYKASRTSYNNLLTVAASRNAVNISLGNIIMFHVTACQCSSPYNKCILVHIEWEGVLQLASLVTVRAVQALRPVRSKIFWLKGRL